MKRRFMIVFLYYSSFHDRLSSFRVRSTPRRPEQGSLPHRARSARRLARPKAEQVGSSPWGTVHRKVCRFHWYKPFGCARPKASLYEVTFCQNSKVQKSKIQILLGISIFVAVCKSLLPTLGRSANLSEPWAPRKDTSRSFAHCYRNIVKLIAISNFTVYLYFMSKIQILVGISIFAAPCKSLLPTLGRSANLNELARPSASQGVGRCAPAAFLSVVLRPTGGAPHSKANNSNSIWLIKASHRL